MQIRINAITWLILQGIMTGMFLMTAIFVGAIALANNDVVPGMFSVIMIVAVFIMGNHLDKEGKKFNPEVENDNRSEPSTQ